MKCIIWGQEDYAKRICSYLKWKISKKYILMYIHPLDIEKPDKTVFNFDLYDAQLNTLPKESKIYVAFSIKYHIQTKQKLENMGFSNIIMYNAEVDNILKKDYFENLFAMKNRPFRMIYDMYPKHVAKNQSIKIYMAKSVFDKPISNYSFNLSSHIIPIQVGAALTNKRIAEVLDNTGENISERNRRYSEMTAFYWMWKNAKSNYLGICHYRRLWVHLDEIAKKLLTTDVDVVLPLPTLAEHSVYEDYLLKHIPDVWKTMLDVLQENAPDYYNISKHIFNETIFYASNMCILKRNVLNELCQWMFPIVMEIEHRIGTLNDTYYNRYAGFVTERLITLYFLYNKQCWNIAHAEKIFIG
ncbi:DUF4422 domain-containing protein [Pectinatus frisingensis]|uniref:DUF4422 domain-containing protein n=1 Tax=Pectinatus frisingensis TaxID=865 RepID=UPI0018C6B905|nr:DUF4422 domain-containing protein [Pectinatus frisingensis]